MKTKRYILLLVACVLAACSPDGYDIINFENYSIDKVVCEAPSNILIADGLSELRLNVRLYTQSGTYTDKYGEVRPVYLEIAPERYSKHDVRFYYENGTEVKGPITMNSATTNEMSFYATVDGIRSTKSVYQLQAEFPALAKDATPESPAPEVYDEEVTFDVTVRPEIKYADEIVIPVIFHVLQTTKSVEMGGGMTIDAVDYVLDSVWNKTFNRVHDRASNGANPRVRFVKATHDPSGGELVEPGINRKAYESLTTTHSTLLADKDIIWDHKSYLNVWVHDTWASVSYKTLDARGMPKIFYPGVYDAEKYPLPAGVTAAEKTPEELEKWTPTYLDEIGIPIRLRNFVSKAAQYNTLMGSYLGLAVNRVASEVKDNDDMCDDTMNYYHMYSGKSDTGNGNKMQKYSDGYPWVVYHAHNIMDQVSYQSTITQDQAERIRWVLENSPLRQARVR